MRSIRCILCVAVFCFTCLSANAQIRVSATPVQVSGTIKGVVTSQASGKVIQGVSVMAKTKDSLLLSYTFTNEKGEYILSKLPFGQDFKVFVSLYGYHRDTSEVQRFKVLEPMVINRNWTLSTDLNALDEVTVKARKPPFVIRKDTLEFDAASFKLLPHAILEDLLNRLPGVLIDKEGNITVNGKKATKIQVDGRDFFGRNTVIATKNLPANIIDKIQVTPTDDPAKRINRMLNPATDDVTINLLLKKDQNRGLLGNVMAGYGTKDRYSASGMLSSFGGKIRFGLFGSGGNGNMINSAGANPGAGPSGMPVGGTLTATGGGLAAAIRGAKSPGLSGAGLNDRKNLSSTFNTELSKKVKVNGNYNFSHQKSILEKQSQRINFQDSGNLKYFEDQSGADYNNTHSYLTNIEFAQDTLTTWRFMATVNYAPFKREKQTSALSEGPDGAKLNSSDIYNLSDGTRKGFTHSLFFGRRSKDGKTGFILNWNINGDQTGDQLTNYSENEFINNVGISSKTTIDQKGDSRRNSLNNDLSLQLSRNLNKSFTGQLEYRLNQQSNRLKKYLFNINGSGKYDVLDTAQSGDSKDNNIQQNVSFQLAYNKERFSVALNGGMRFINQHNRLFIQDTLITINQRQFTPKLILNYSLANNGNLNLSYDIASYAPSADQLSPVNDNSNPLLVIIGNPFLKTGLGHNINAGFSKFFPNHEANLHVNGGANFIKNQIIQDVVYDDQGRQVQSYRNVDGYNSFRLSGGLQKGYHIKELSIRPFIDLALNKKQDVGFINSHRNETKQWQYGGNTGFAVSYMNFVSLSSSADVSFNKTDYSLNDREDLNYNTQNYSFTLKVSPVSRIEFGSQFSYQYNSQIPKDFQRTAVVLNSSFGCRFLKSQQLNFKLFVNDVFNNAIVNSTIVTPFYSENSSVNSLKRYFLFSLQYNFNGLSATNKIR
ncbi:outer membrane beta-barrel protein [Pedobacter hiemivivus]|uniref:Outer membrane protein beta-barrel domain-containing protein n=1 Tax=Pedobacter hiemivivus TaxID=2530454 RepID=A0A4R0NJJ0_9SPHI|nr:outer membrane beta-barrel protein [Pedobacter hiemivivus]TCC99463.1 hypothetical protein EZ444_01955 [Pedobacter hiemivivus]